MILYVLLALTVAGWADGVLNDKATAIVALVLAIVAVVSLAPSMRGRLP